MGIDVDISLFQASQGSQILAISFVAPWGLKEHRKRSEPRVIEQKSKRLKSQFSFANVLMPVHAAAQVFLGVVQMKRLHPVETHDGIKLSEHRLVGRTRPQIVTGCKQVTGVEADTQPVRVLSLTQNLGKVFEAISQVAALTCRVLDQDLSSQPGFRLRAKSRLSMMRCNPAASPDPTWDPG